MDSSDHADVHSRFDYKLFGIFYIKNVQSFKATGSTSTKQYFHTLGNKKLLKCNNRLELQYPSSPHSGKRMEC